MPTPDYERLVDAHYTNLYRFALSLARNPEDAADLVQQTFFIWAKKGHLLRDASKAKSWLFTTLYREFLRQHRRRGLFTTFDGTPAEYETPAENDDPVDKLDAESVLESLQCVDETFRIPLTLFYLEDLSYKEIAETLDVPIGTVMSRLSRGKAQLRSILSRKDSGAGNILPLPRSNIS